MEREYKSSRESWQGASSAVSQPVQLFREALDHPSASSAASAFVTQSHCHLWVTKRSHSWTPSRNTRRQFTHTPFFLTVLLVSHLPLLVSLRGSRGGLLTTKISPLCLAKADRCFHFPSLQVQIITVVRIRSFTVLGGIWLCWWETIMHAIFGDEHSCLFFQPSN